MANEIDYNLFLRAKKGNKSAQFSLYNKLQQATKIINRIYYLSAKRVGYDFSDFEDVFCVCFQKFMAKYQPEKGTIIGFFKVIYERQVATEIKRKYSLSNYKYCLQILRCSDYDEDNVESFEYNFPVTDDKKELFEDEIYNYVMKHKSLDEQEKLIMSLYINDFSVREIAKILHLNYNTVASKCASIKRKCRKILEKNGTL